MRKLVEISSGLNADLYILESSIDILKTLPANSVRMKTLIEGAITDTIKDRLKRLIEIFKAFIQKIKDWFIRKFNLAYNDAEKMIDVLSRVDDSTLFRIPIKTREYFAHLEKRHDSLLNAMDELLNKEIISDIEHTIRIYVHKPTFAKEMNDITLNGLRKRPIVLELAYLKNMSIEEAKDRFFGKYVEATYIDSGELMSFRQVLKDKDTIPKLLDKCTSMYTAELTSLENTISSFGETDALFYELFGTVSAEITKYYNFNISMIMALYTELVTIIISALRQAMQGVSKAKKEEKRGV